MRDKSTVILIVLLIFIAIFSPQIQDIVSYTGEATKGFISCIDTDTGKNYDASGTVTAVMRLRGTWRTRMKDVTHRFPDKCLDKTSLQENYCEGTNPKTIKYTCPGGCENGACIQHPNLGEQKTLVILISFENDEIPNSNYISDSNKIVFDYLNRYIREVSYNKSWISGKVVGPYIISNIGCWQSGPWQDNHGVLLEKAIRAADNDVDFRNYNRIIIFNKDYDYCPSSPQGSIGIIDESSSYYRLMVSNDGKIKASVLWDLPGLGVNLNNNQVLVHEFGHNLGLAHVDNFLCYDSQNNRATFSNNCQIFGNLMSFTDIMGNAGRDAHFNAYNKEKIGWLSPENIVNTTNGNYVLRALETASNGIKIIKIPIKNMQYEYFLEYRKPIGFDAYDPWNVPLNGVFLYVHKLNTPFTFLLDLPPFPDQATFEHSPIIQSQPYVDSLNGISISVQSISEDYVIINVITNQ